MVIDMVGHHLATASGRMNGLDVWVANGGRADVLACIGGLVALTTAIAVIDAIWRRRARPALSPGVDDGAAFCTADDYPVPSSLTTHRLAPAADATVLALEALITANRELREATARGVAEGELRALRRQHALAVYRYRFAASREFGFGPVS